MGKTSRFKHAYRSNASKLHKNVGEIIRNHPLLKHYKSYQEYPVNRINPNFPDGKCKFDWVILDLKCVIEVHGQQHYARSDFFHKTEGEFEAQLKRDQEKKDAAEHAGWTYIVVPYNEELDVGELINLAIANNAPLNVPRSPLKPLKRETDTWARLQKEKARKIRKEQYRKIKKRRKESK